MKTPLSELYFDLPDELIALHPEKKRENCRLLSVNRNDQGCQDLYFYQIIDLLNPGDLLVFNDVKVDKARIFGQKDTGGIHEVLLISSSADRFLWQAVAKKTRRLKKGDSLTFEENLNAKLTKNPEDGKIALRFNRPLTSEILDRIGEIPLPPYIRGKRSYQKEDEVHYQTVFAREGGAKAAPTAGLHFSEDLLAAMAKKGLETAFIRLFVSLGTFEPVKTEYAEDHPIHEESYLIQESEAEKINRALKENRRIIAVGTTVVRALESAFSGGEIKVGPGSTRIFMTPGYEFKVVRGLITNFHTPYSTLLLLVSAFMGKDLMMQCYRHAVQERYRFFSYGDAMFIF